MIASFMQDMKMKVNPLPKVEEDGQRDKQGGNGQSVADNCHVEQDVGGLREKDKNVKLQINCKKNIFFSLDKLTCKLINGKTDLLTIKQLKQNSQKINKLYFFFFSFFK